MSERNCKMVEYVGMAAMIAAFVCAFNYAYTLRVVLVP